MKTNIALRFSSWMILFGILASNSLFAQNRIGMSAQASTSNVEINGLGILDVISPYLHSIPQYNIGLVYERELSNQWAIITGVNYATRGFGLEENVDINLLGLDVPVGANINTRLNYMEVPAAVQYKFTKQGVTPYIKAGLSAGYAISGKMQPTVNAIIDWKLPSIPVNLENDLYNRFDIAALGGIGVSIPTNDIGSFQIELNYRHGLSDMFQDNITDIRIKSNGISAGIGYTMRF
jgi:hypothetical protein